MEKLNRLSSGYTGKSPEAALAEERSHLWKYPGEMECYIMASLKVDKYATFSFGTNRYSVPDYLVGTMVDVKVYSNRLKVYHNNLHLYTHERTYVTYRWLVEIDHYLVTLARKPGAVHGSAALEQSPPEVRRIYQPYFTNQPREFIEVLLYCKDNNIRHDKLEETVSKVSRLCPRDVTADKILALLGNQSETITSVPSASRKPDEIEDLSFKQLQEITMLAESRIN